MAQARSGQPEESSEKMEPAGTPAGASGCAADRVEGAADPERRKARPAWTRGLLYSVLFGALVLLWAFVMYLGALLCSTVSPVWVFVGALVVALVLMTRLLFTLRSRAMAVSVPARSGTVHAGREPARAPVKGAAGETSTAAENGAGAGLGVAQAIGAVEAVVRTESRGTVPKAAAERGRGVVASTDGSVLTMPAQVPEGGARWRPRGWAALAFLVMVLGTAAFLRSCVTVTTVETATLEPLASQGDHVVILLSRYIRPVHDDLVLLRLRTQARGGAPGEAEARLGRVLAQGGDCLEARDGKLVVNGITLDLSRRDQGWALDKSSRAQKSRRLVGSLLWPLGRSSSRKEEKPWERVLRWELEDWGPRFLPDRMLIVLTDGAVLPNGTGVDAQSSGSDHGAVVIAQEEVLGRAMF